MTVLFDEEVLELIGRVSSEVNSAVFRARKRLDEFEKVLQRLDLRVYVEGPVIYSCNEPWCGVDVKYQPDALNFYYLDFGHINSGVDGRLLIRKQVYLIDDATNRRHLIQKDRLELLGAPNVAWRLLIAANQNLESFINWVAVALNIARSVIQLPTEEPVSPSGASV